MQSRWRRSVLVVALTAASLFGIGQPAALAGSGWAPTGEMVEARRSHVAAELPDGRVLVAGGVTGAGDVRGAELYDPVAGTWTPIAAPLEARHYATATTLPGGKVLVTGGTVGSAATARSEIYDPASNTWTATGSLNQARANHSALLLNDGRVLVIGGEDRPAYRATSEIYDPATGFWTSTGSMSVARSNLQAALLADGRVLAAGGYESTGSLNFHASAEIYTPATGSWSPTGAMAAGRAQGAGVRLADGRVLVGGGVYRDGFNGSAELYDPATGAWAAGGSVGFSANVMTGTVLDDGRVLLVGDVPTTSLYDPLTSSTTAYSLSDTRALATPIRLRNGRVLIAGGSGSGTTHRSAELFTPPTHRAPDDADFGTATVGEPVERDLAIENAGGNRLWVDGVTVAGDGAGDFSIVADGCSGTTVAPAASCTVRVRFRPSAVGPRGAELRFDDNAEASPPVALGGAGAVRTDPGPGPGPDLPPTPSGPLAPSDPTPAPPTGTIVAPPPGPVGRAACPRYYVRLVGIEPTGTSRRPRVRLSGIAAAELTGRTVEIQRDGRRVGSARVRADRTVVATVATLRNPRAAGRVRFRLVLDERIRSAALKATRGATIAARRQLSRGRIQIDGRIRGVRRASRLTVQGVPICGAGATVTGTARTDRRGRFRVVLAAPTDQATALVYRVRLARRTVTLPIVVPAAR